MTLTVGRSLSLALYHFRSVRSNFWLWLHPAVVRLHAEIDFQFANWVLDGRVRSSRLGGRATDLNWKPHFRVLTVWHTQDVVFR